MAGPPLPTAGELGELREGLQERQREREDRAALRHLVPWRPLAQAPDLRLVRDRAVVRLGNQMIAFRAVWIFEPLDQPGGLPVRALLGWQGEDWVALAPGAWRVSLIVGQPGGRGLAQPAQEVRAERGRAYELTLTREAEASFRDQARAAAEAEQKKSAPADKKQTLPAGNGDAPARRVKSKPLSKLWSPKIPSHLGR